MATAEGAKRPDEDLMTVSSQIQDGNAIPCSTVPHIFNQPVTQSRCDALRLAHSGHAGLAAATYAFDP